MITRFKLFENTGDNLYRILSEGDYVLINSPDVSKKQIVCRLIQDPIKDDDGFVIDCVSDDLIDVTTFYDYEIVKKIKKDDIRLYKNVNKYNL